MIGNLIISNSEIRHQGNLYYISLNAKNELNDQNIVANLDINSLVEDEKNNQREDRQLSIADIEFND